MIAAQYKYQFSQSIHFIQFINGKVNIYKVLKLYQCTMAILTDYWKYDVLAFLIGFITLIYFYARQTYTYWERKGFKYMPDVSYIFGHFKPTFTQKESLGNFITRIYNSTKEPFIGIYSVFRPILVVRDPEIVRSILIKDFNYFTDRGVHCNEDEDPLSGHLFALPGQKWRNLRGKLINTEII